jgi:hypothetical protein
MVPPMLEMVFAVLPRLRSPRTDLLGRSVAGKGYWLVGEIGPDEAKVSRDPRRAAAMTQVGARSQGSKGGYTLHGDDMGVFTAVVGTCCTRVLSCDAHASMCSDRTFLAEERAHTNAKRRRSYHRR